MPKSLILLLVGLVLGAWFLMGEKTDVGSKLGLIVTLVLIYAFFRMMTGSSFDEIIAPLLSLRSE